MALATMSEPIQTSRIQLGAPSQHCGAVLVRNEGVASAPLLGFIHGGGCSGRYFEEPALSPVALATQAGFHVLLIDRPGHGASGPTATERPINASISTIRMTLSRALAHLPHCRDLMLVGHSIGGAITLHLAAEPHDLPLRAVAVSGIGDEPPPVTARWAGAGGPAADPPEDIASTFFGAAGTYDWRAPARLRRAAEPWNINEVREIVSHWPREWPAIADAIAMPVHYRLAETDGIWIAGQSVVARIAARLRHAPEVDAALLTDGGHVYEFHRRGPDMVRSQLGFLLRHATGHGRAETRSGPFAATGSIHTPRTNGS